MDDQKKQKVMLAVLAVLVLGAGGYYVFRDSGTDASRSRKAGPAVRRTRDTTRETAPKSKRITRVRKDRTAEVKVERKKRERKEQKKTERRERGGRKKTKVKKKKMPAAA